MATASQFRSQIREHMKVVGADGKPIGMVDKIEGERIKLTKSSPGSGGEHHFLELSHVAQVRGDEVHMTHDAQGAHHQGGHAHQGGQHDTKHGAESGQAAHGAKSPQGGHSGQPKNRSM